MRGGKRGPLQVGPLFFFFARNKNRAKKNITKQKGVPHDPHPKNI